MPLYPSTPFKATPVTVTDEPYNARADGLFDCTAAFQAAIDSTKTGGINVGRMIRIPAADPSTGYMFSNLTLHAGCHFKGDNSHRTLLIRKAGSTGVAITDEGNPNKIMLEGITVLMNNTVGDGIKFIGDEANLVFGSEAWMDDVYVMRALGDTQWQTGTGIRAHFNASTLGFVRAYGFGTNIHVQGAVLLAPRLEASAGLINYKIVGIGHKIGSVYSESAVTTHVQFGDGAYTTQGCEIAQLASHLLTNATTPQIIHQLAVSSSTQLNAVRQGTINFRTGSVLTNLVKGEATGFVQNITYQLLNGTHVGFYEWNPDKRDNQRLKILSDADYSCENFEPYSVYVFEGVTVSRNFRLPLAIHGYGRTITVKNNDDTMRIIARPHTSDGSIMFNRNSTGLNNILVPPGGSMTFEGSRNGNWYVVNNQAQTMLEATYDPASMATMTGTESASITVADAVFGDFIEVAAPYSLQGCQARAYVHAAGAVRIALFNSTAGTIDLASGLWTLFLQKKA